MSNDTDIEHLQAQLVELQTQLAFQEDTISELNAALALQQQDLEWVKRQWKILREEFANAQAERAGSAVVDEKPPHY